MAIELQQQNQKLLDENKQLTVRLEQYRKFTAFPASTKSTFSGTNIFASGQDDDSFMGDGLSIIKGMGSFTPNKDGNGFVDEDTQEQMTKLR